MRWFSVRAVYAHRVADQDDTWFEERIILFRAPDHAVLLQLAKDESSRYLDINPGVRLIGEFVAYALREGLVDLDRAEVWSMARESSADADSFYSQYYADIEPSPDD